MKNFLRYTLGGLISALVVSALVGAVLGPLWALGTLCVFFAAVAARDAWQLQELNRWLHRQQLGSVPHPTGAWGLVFTQLFRLEKHAGQAQQKLREALERFQQAGMALPNGVVVMDATDRIQWCNPSAETHFGIDLKQDREQSLPYLIRRPEFIEYLSKSQHDNPLILRRVRGTALSLSIQIVPYSNNERLLVSHDITQVEQDERVRQDFVANVSHELRTPITVVGGFIETLLEGETLEPTMLHRVLGTMQSQTQRMQSLVEELLSLSRLEGQHTPAAETPVSVEALMRQLVQMGEQLSKGRHAVCGIIKTPDTLLGADNELLSAFGNLVTNAIRYTPEGGKITLLWELDRGEGVFSVQDTGIGIPSEHIPRLTERFYRVDRARSRETGGTGLGLAIVKQILLHHDARLEISSQPGLGSTFSVRIPAARVVAAIPAQTTPNL
jgi:two-component system phosphate regulon sensor histidine kinase PhoR